MSSDAEMGMDITQAMMDQDRQQLCGVLCCAVVCLLCCVMLQSRDVVVYRLVTCGTVEEKIYRKQVHTSAEQTDMPPAS
jgi:hypothetical protein